MVATYRTAGSLLLLAREVRSRWPRTTIWFKGDSEHAKTDSDHNPNDKGVVCAGDFLGNAGMRLGWFAQTVVATNPPALKYVIYNRRIWFPGYGWSEYRGSNPHLTHVHVSVGWGPDGQSTGPYDDESPWGITTEDPVFNERALFLLEKAERLGAEWHLQDQGEKPRSDGTTYGWTQVREDLAQIRASIPSARAIVEEVSRDPAILAALTSAMRDQLPLIPTAQEIARAFIGVISDNVHEAKNGNGS